MRLTSPNRGSGLARLKAVRRLLPFAVAWGLFVPSGASADTLQTALADAHAWHPAIQTARAQVRIAEATVNEAGLGNSLTATGNFGASMAEREVKPSRGDAESVVTSARLSLSKRIFDFGRVRGRVGVEQSLLDAARYQLQVVEQQVLHDAVIAYLNVFRARARLQLAVKGEELVQSDLKATQERFEVGDVTPTDVAQAEARLADRRADRLNREQDVDQALREYRLATGSEFSESAAYPNELPSVPASEIEVEDSSVNMHPAVLMRRARVDAATRGKDTMALEILPTFDLTGTAAYSRNPNTFLRVFDRPDGRHRGDGAAVVRRARGCGGAQQRGAVGTDAARTRCRDAARPAAGTERVAPLPECFGDDHGARIVGAREPHRLRWSPPRGRGWQPHHPRRAECQPGAAGGRGPSRRSAARPAGCGLRAAPRHRPDDGRATGSLSRS